MPMLHGGVGPASGRPLLTIVVVARTPSGPVTAAGAAVHVTRAGGGEGANAVTNKRGLARFALAPGPYDVDIEHHGHHAVTHVEHHVHEDVLVEVE